MAAPVSSHSTFAPHQSSPLARNTSPFTDPRTPPCTPRNTAKLWDEYERLAVERARSRERPVESKSLHVPPESPRLSNGTVLDIIRSYDPYPSPRIPASSPASSVTPSPKSEFSFPVPVPQKHASRAQNAVPKIATCKICQQPILSHSGRCENCKRTIIKSPTSGESTPPLSPSNRNFASIDLAKLQQGKKKEHQCTTSIGSSSNKRKTFRPPSTAAQDFYQCTNPPIRLSSLKPPPLFSSSPLSSFTDPPYRTRSRNPSLTDPNEPALRVQMNCTTTRTAPSTPPYTSSSSSSITSSRPSTRPSSLANVTTPPHTLIPTAAPTHTTTPLSPSPYPYPVASPYSPTPTLRASTSTTASSPPSVCRASYQLQNTMSVWEDWDDGKDGQGEKVGLVGYWRGKVWRGSRGSLGPERERERGSGEEKDVGRDAGNGKTKRWLRVVECGCKE